MSAIIYRTDAVDPGGRERRPRRRDGVGHRARADRPGVHARRRRRPFSSSRTTSSPRAAAGDTGARAGRRPGLLQRRARGAGQRARGLRRPSSQADAGTRATSSCSATSTPTRRRTRSPRPHRRRASSTSCRHAAGEYTYTFDGELGSLDHALATPSLRGARSPAPTCGTSTPTSGSATQYYGVRRHRGGHPCTASTDHDPIMVGVSVRAAPPVDDRPAGDQRLPRPPRGQRRRRRCGRARRDGRRRSAPPTRTRCSSPPATSSARRRSRRSSSRTVPTIDALNADRARRLARSATTSSTRAARTSTTACSPLRRLPVPRREPLRPGDRRARLPTSTGSPSSTGVDVGFVGAVTEELPIAREPGGIATLEVAAGRARGQPRRRPAHRRRRGQRRGRRRRPARARGRRDDATIERATDDSAFGQIVTGANAEIDAIFSGHTHHALRPPGAGRRRTDGYAAGRLSPASTARTSAHVALTVDPQTGDVAARSPPTSLAADRRFTPDPEVARDRRRGRRGRRRARLGAARRDHRRLQPRRASPAGVRRTAAASRRSATSSPTCSCGPPQDARRADRLHEPGRPARRPHVRVTPAAGRPGRQRHLHGGGDGPAVRQHARDARRSPARR